MNFKTYSKSNKLEKRLKNDSSKVLIFKDTHEPIVDRTLFETVQKHFAGRKRPDKMGETDKFAGYLYCGDYGKRLYLHRGKTIRPENNTFQCGGYQKSKHNCTVHSIKGIVMETIVLENLKKVTSFARSEPEKFYELATKRGKAEASKIEKHAEKEKATAEARIQKIDSIIRCLYEDRVVGRIFPERYDEMAASYEKELADLKQKQAELAQDLLLYSKQEQAIKDFIEKSKEFVEMPKLTAELLHTFIQRVDVYEKPTKYSRTEGNPVMIYYKYQMTTSEQWQILTGEGYTEADDAKAEIDTNTPISA